MPGRSSVLPFAAHSPALAGGSPFGSSRSWAQGACRLLQRLPWVCMTRRQGHRILDAGPERMRGGRAHGTHQGRCTCLSSARDLPSTDMHPFPSGTEMRHNHRLNDIHLNCPQMDTYWRRQPVADGTGPEAPSGARARRWLFPAPAGAGLPGDGGCRPGGAACVSAPWPAGRAAFFTVSRSSSMCLPRSCRVPARCGGSHDAGRRMSHGGLIGPDHPLESVG